MSKGSLLIDTSRSFIRGVDRDLDTPFLSSPTLAALHRTRSTDSLVAASDMSETSSWSETSSFFGEGPESSVESVHLEWPINQESTHQVEEAMRTPIPEGGVHAPTNIARSSTSQVRPDSSVRFDGNVCRGLNAGVYITPPRFDASTINDDDDATRPFPERSLQLHGARSLTLESIHEADDNSTNAEVLSNDPYDNPREQKKSSFSFFSKPKAPMRKPDKPVSKSNLGIRIPRVSISSVLNPFAKRQAPISNSEGKAQPTSGGTRSSLQENQETEMFFDQETERRREEIMHFANSSTLTLRLDSVEDMQALNAALPSVGW